MIYTDLPIQSDEKDILHRTGFVHQIAQLIVECSKNNDEGFVIGLEGAWGTGKTSILNLLRHDKLLKKSNINVCRFNSWLILDSRNLTIEFFKTLLANIESEQENSSIKEYIKVQMQKITSKLNRPFKDVAAATSFNLKTEIGTFSIKTDWNKIFSEETLQKKKTKVYKKLKGSNKYILYLIDDIDRLPNSDIALVMQLVKNIADFPHVIYLLAYDREVVENALEQINGHNGKEFIKKVVQVPISLPAFNVDDLKNYFSQQIKKIIQSKKAWINYEHLEDVIHYGVFEYINSLRDCNRLLNVFQSRYMLCNQFCDAGDLICVILLNLYEPQVYAYIQQNAELLLLCGPQTKEVLEQYENIAHSVSKEVDDYANKFIEVKTILSLMFPKWALYAGEQVYSSKDVSNNRIYKIENFNSYFLLIPQQNQVPRDEVNKFLLELDEQELYDCLCKWEKQGQLESAYSIIEAYCYEDNKNTKLPESRVTILLRPLSRFYNEQRSINDIRKWCIGVANQIIGKGTCRLPPQAHIAPFSENAKDVYNNIFSDENICLDFLEQARCTIEHHMYSQRALTNTILKKCNQVFLQRIKTAIYDKTFFDNYFIRKMTSHMIDDSLPIMKKYLSSLKTWNEIQPWIRRCFSEIEPQNRFRRWECFVKLLRILPNEFQIIIDKEIQRKGKDIWILSDKWTLIVLYKAYMAGNNIVQSDGITIINEYKLIAYAENQLKLE